MTGRSCCLWVGLTVCALDQITKYICVLLNPCQVPLIPHCLSLTFVMNTGSIWGLGSAYTSLLAYAGLAIVGLLSIQFVWKQPTYPIWIGMLLGGISGNTLDRFFRGYVVDFLDFYVQNWHWPCFNLADAAITSACLGLIVLYPKHS